MKLSDRLFRYQGRNETLWQLIYRANRPMLQAAQIHRATLSRHTDLVAVTGTYGKTTTARAVRAALGLPEDRWTERNANCWGLVAWSLMRHSFWQRHAVVEVGIGGPGQMASYMRALRPNQTIVTCIGNEHIQAFESREHLRSEKAEAVRILPPTGTAILNGDDPDVMWMATQTRARIVRFGFDPSCDVSASDLTLDWPHGTRLTLHTQGRTYPLRVRLLGRNMIYPILAAATTGLMAGRDMTQVLEGLEALPPTSGRLQPVSLSGGAMALCDDYKSTVETVHAALDLLGTLPAGRRIVVLGGLDSPPSPQGPHYRAVGEHAARAADLVIIVGGTLARYRPGLKRGGLSDSSILSFRNVQETTAALHNLLRPEDIVLVKGRSGQHLARIVLALSGREVRCNLQTCRLHLQFCDNCPLLARKISDDAEVPDETDK